ncbi:hypothetical protein PVW51_05030 [Sulfitobacter sp. PR48]|uniref:hypothetical protein n=1 Tax=unclassified Sulfitobacter TaxID=196795 RepID=UPI0022AFC728|nr:MULTISPECIES: hypothetical protein [unclassified Sulfitobacter]MCZ4254417.1 hypothetical protein [Sulfitobacter sp. G21635-S1]MDD9720042.1 hypothetical protein [Sulfitobacter sp. PR48]
MLTEKDINAKSQALLRLLQAKLGVRGRDLEQALRRAGRRLPRRVRGQAARLVAAQKMAGHPKLARQLDPREFSQAYADVSAHLAAIDVADRRKGRLIGLAAVVAANLLIVITAFLFWLSWRGYL